ncbi:hypothetical protein METUNv1_02567 [Methyloversatilis universalis FAM5]|uniref:Uncharacterized protein n=1 Tax=Methyloversatilis universalis (strain ATCC BAA-1314 / DSM 25237 / JCM 13912 / CCUG 52030 / FAM5) TaxID=1000565 RepID=F5RE49_METUF|nr:hypothetical protein METUNv1_02567 [Methyloversatilis universalis FAM5]
MRGTGYAAQYSGRMVRFIPAHAGNGCSSPIPTSRAAVHPRACGERAGLVTLFALGYGSSPRMRGTVDGPAAGEDRQRFIPAHAGNGQGGTDADRSGTVHPRACGERLYLLHLPGHGRGSSPRMRGTVQDKN